jgi:hypothetical protein
MAVSSSDVRLAETAAVSGTSSIAGTRPADAMVDPPRWEKQVLELALSWRGLSPEHHWAAEQLRVFLLTWDPFEWRPDRPAAFATSTSRAEAVGLVLYVPLWQALAMAGGDGSALPTVLGPLTESVLLVGSEQQAAITDGSYAAGVHSGALPRLLSRIPGEAALPTPAVTVVGAGWQPIQFDVLEDLGQDIFGPADLDRAAVRFREPGEKRPGCPGCAGRSVAFPDGLKDVQEVICGAHRAEALRITTARLEAAKASNPEGWEALLDAGQRLLEPHLPNGLGPRLVAAAAAPEPTPADLQAQAEIVIEAGSLMAGLPDALTGLGGRLAPVRPWLEGLEAAVAAAGLDDQVPAVANAINELLCDPTVAQAEAAAAAAQDELPAKPQPFRRDARIGRNALCPCGSGKKYKFCHGH